MWHWEKDWFNPDSLESTEGIIGDSFEVEVEVAVESGKAANSSDLLSSAFKDFPGSATTTFLGVVVFILFFELLWYIRKREWEPDLERQEVLDRIDTEKLALYTCRRLWRENYPQISHEI